MNDLPDELMAACHRQRIREEIEQIRLEKLALKSYRSRPYLFGQTMFYFGNWLISVGNQLRNRYEIPDVSQSAWIQTGSTE